MKPEDFCSPDDIRDVARQPFTLDGYTIATNGWALLVTPASDYPSADQAFVRESSQNSIRRIIDEIKAKYPLLVPSPLTLPEMIDCKVCKGSGKPITKPCPECHGEGLVFFENYHNDYEFECMSCEGLGIMTTSDLAGDCGHCSGTGKQYDEEGTVDAFDMHFNPKLVELFINAPDLQVAPDHDGFRICFKSGDSFGALMALRK